MRSIGFGDMNDIEAKVKDLVISHGIDLTGLREMVIKRINIFLIRFLGM